MMHRRRRSGEYHLSGQSPVGDEAWVFLTVGTGLGAAILVDGPSSCWFLFCLGR